MATSVDVLLTQFKAAGQGDVINAMRGVAASASGVANVANIAATAIGITAGAVTAAGVYAVKTAAQFEQLRIRMNSVFGSAKAGEDAFQWAKEFASSTPFSLMEVIDQMTTMRALGLDVSRDFKTLADTTYALGLGAEGIQRVVLQLGQMKAVGHATMQDLRPLMQANIPVLEILQEKMGLTPDQVANIGNQRIPADKVIDAIMSGLAERFHGGTERATRTLAGQINNLSDNIQKVAAAVGDGLLPAVTEIATAFNDFITETRLQEIAAWTRITMTSIREAADTFSAAWLAVAATVSKAFDFLTPGKAGREYADYAASAAVAAAQAAARARAELPFDVANLMLAQAGLNNRAGKIAPMKPTATDAARDTGPSIVERFILGGGERLRRGVGGLDIARKMLPGGPPVVTVKVEAGDNSPLAKAIEGIAQKVSTVTLRQLISDPRGRAALKAALAGS